METTESSSSSLHPNKACPSLRRPPKQRSGLISEFSSGSVSRTHVVSSYLPSSLTRRPFPLDIRATVPARETRLAHRLVSQVTNQKCALINKGPGDSLHLPSAVQPSAHLQVLLRAARPGEAFPGACPGVGWAPPQHWGCGLNTGSGPSSGQPIPPIQMPCLVLAGTHSWDAPIFTQHWQELSALGHLGGGHCIDPTTEAGLSQMTSP